LKPKQQHSEPDNKRRDSSENPNYSSQNSQDDLPARSSVDAAKQGRKHKKHKDACCGDCPRGTEEKLTESVVFEAIPS